jgi:hypothetical protein
MTRAFLPAFLSFIIALPAMAAELNPETVRAWDQYMKWAEAKVQREVSNSDKFLLQNWLPSAEQAVVRRQLESGEIVVRQMKDIAPKEVHFKIPDGEIHHWWGAILLRNMELSQLMNFLQDYDHHAGKFADVEQSRLISKNGYDYRVFFRFRRSKAFVTAVYNTEQDCQYVHYGPNRVFSHSIATKIAEVQNPGKESEREKKPGHDNGYLWRLVSWWRFEQTGKDIIVELESASLSRDIPLFIKLIPGIIGYIRSTPRESLESVLASVRSNMKSPARQ